MALPDADDAIHEKGLKKMKSTGELEHQIRTSETPAVLAEKSFKIPAIVPYMNGLLHDRGLTVQDVVVGCHLSRSYAYQLFNGNRIPTRGFLLNLAFMLKLPEAEAQRLLKVAGRQPLYVRNRRDAAILYGLNHGMAAEETEELLRSLGEEGLG